MGALFILVANAYQFIDRCGLELLLDGDGSINRKVKCTGRPYLGAPGGCDGKWNVRGGKEEVGQEATCKHTHIWKDTHLQRPTQTFRNNL